MHNAVVPELAKRIGAVIVPLSESSDFFRDTTRLD